MNFDELVLDPAELFEQFQAGALKPEQMREALPWIWRHRPDRDPLDNAAAWHAMVVHAGYFEWKSGMPGGRPARRPMLARRLFRGATEERRFGLSWTTKPDIARHFASYRQPHGEVGRVWVATFTPSRLLARLGDEEEYLVEAEGADVQPWTAARTSGRAWRLRGGS